MSDNNLNSIKGSESNDPIDQYIIQHSLRLSPIQKELIQYTKSLPGRLPRMLGSSDEAQFLQLLLQLSGAKRCIEVGTFTGYTALTIASILPPDGHLIACDISDQYIRQDLWKKAGLDSKITLKLGPAVDTLQQLLEQNGENSFDFVFIDADKTNYLNYYELALKLLRPNGFIAIDNTLWDGRVLDASDESEDTVAIREINNVVRDDERIDISFLRLGDGTTLCRKK